MKMQLHVQPIRPKFRMRYVVSTTGDPAKHGNYSISGKITYRDDGTVKVSNDIRAALSLGAKVLNASVWPIERITALLEEVCLERAKQSSRERKTIARRRKRARNAQRKAALAKQKADRNRNRKRMARA